MLMAIRKYKKLKIKHFGNCKGINMIEIEYEAIAFKQTASSDLTVSFCAKANEINIWAGIPQKKNFDNVESSGFQRNIKTERMKSLISFYSNEKNIIQNPLLCASRNSNDWNKGGVFFIADLENNNERVQKGKVLIKYDDYSQYFLKDILVLFKETLEERIPLLSETAINQSLLEQLKALFYSNDEYTERENNEVERVELESSHITDLWQEVSCRIEILNNVREDLDEIIGFDKESIISYLLPATIVDGQHRLKGAIAHLETIFSSPEVQDEVEALIVSGIGAEAANVQITNKFVRNLPISLILCDDPAEHVFQFVVVNQKATPINTALLGTIVSTSLSNEELERVSHRLKDADIPLEDSKAVSFATRNISSPFYNLVQTGIAGENAGKLPWTVMKSLVSIIKDLKGAKFFSETDRTDYSDLWKRKLLAKSEIVAGDDLEEKLENWSSDSGVWKEVFITFWDKIKKEFASDDDNERKNYWGNTDSNLYNKISLMILIADFFRFISEGRGIALSSIGELEEVMDEWLYGIDRSYFDREWLLRNTKKDSPGIRKQWSYIWTNYSKDPRKLPPINLYRVSFGK
jgi:hypothetical protein